MVEQITIQTISQVATAIGVLAAASYYIFTLRNTNKMRKTQLAILVQSQISMKDFWEPWIDVIAQQDFSSYEEWIEKYNPYDNPQATINLYATITHFNGWGWLIKEKLLDPDMLFNYWPSMNVNLTYKKVKPILEALRERYGDSESSRCFDLLNEEALKRQPDLKIPDDIPLYEQTRTQE